MKKFLTIGLILFLSPKTMTIEPTPIANNPVSIKSFWNEKIDATKTTGIVIATHGLANVLKNPIKGSLICGLGAAIIYNSKKINDFLDTKKPEIEKYLSDFILNAKEETKEKIVQTEETKEENSKKTE